MANETNNLVKTLTKGGATGVIIALVLLIGYIIWSNQKTTEMNNTLIGNHIDHSTAAINKQADSNFAIAESLTELSTIIKLRK